MTKRQKDYINSMNNWIKGEEINIDQLKLNNDFNSKEIEFHKQSLALGVKELKFREENLKKIKEKFQEFINLKN
jgi:hypothetical protein